MIQPPSQFYFPHTANSNLRNWSPNHFVLLVNKNDLFSTPITQPSQLTTVKNDKGKSNIRSYFSPIPAKRAKFETKQVSSVEKKQNEKSTDGEHKQEMKNNTRNVAGSARYTLDEKWNLPQICLVQICCKYEIRKALQPVQRWRWPNLHKSEQIQPSPHLHWVQSSYLQHICTRQILCKFVFSSCGTVASFTRNGPRKIHSSNLQLEIHILFCALFVQRT